jgi:hypothetical protein
LKFKETYGATPQKEEEEEERERLKTDIIHKKILV